MHSLTDVTAFPVKHRAVVLVIVRSLYAGCPPCANVYVCVCACVTPIILRVPQVYASGSAVGSDPYYIDVQPPVVTNITGSSGMALYTDPVELLGFVPVTSGTNGTTRVRVMGRKYAVCCYSLGLEFF